MNHTLYVSPAANGSRWLLRRPSTAAPSVRLICFSYAGGSGSIYLQWQPSLPAGVELVGVQLPGRGSRLKETPLRSMPALVEAISLEIAAMDDGTPFVFFGHSLGALVAFEVARHQQSHGLAMPQKLIVSGCDAPQFRSPVRNLHELDGEAFVAALAQYNGTPPELLAHKELISLLAPAIRADFYMASHYEYRSGPLLTIPVTVLAGRRDADSNLHQVESWRLETSNHCALHWFDGDHFFINSEKDQVLALLNNELKQFIFSR
ncbi:MAG: thioesterase II family protein [Janthinobacterium lividum]